MKIYFARSIRGQIGVAVQELQSSLHIFGEVLAENFDYSKNESRDQQIYAQDMALLARADVVIAEVSNPSLGVGYEIATAERLGKPILALAKEGVLVSAMVAASPHVVLKRYVSISDAHAHIRAFLKK